ASRQSGYARSRWYDWGNIESGSDRRRVIDRALSYCLPDQAASSAGNSRCCRLSNCAGERHWLCCKRVIATTASTRIYIRLYLFARVCNGCSGRNINRTTWRQSRAYYADKQTEKHFCRTTLFIGNKTTVGILDLTQASLSKNLENHAKRVSQ